MDMDKDSGAVTIEQDDITEIKTQLAVVMQKLTEMSEQMSHQFARHDKQLDDLTLWRASLSDVYVPRREHEAMRHEARLVALEEWRGALMTQVQDRMTAANQQSSSRAAFWISFVVMALLTAASVGVAIVALAHR